MRQNKIASANKKKKKKKKTNIFVAHVQLLAT